MSRKRDRTTNVLVLVVRKHRYKELRPASHSIPHDIVFFRIFDCTLVRFIISTCDSQYIRSLALCEQFDHLLNLFKWEVFSNFEIYRRAIWEVSARTCYSSQRSSNLASCGSGGLSIGLGVGDRSEEIVSPLSLPSAEAASPPPNSI